MNQNYLLVDLTNKNKMINYSFAITADPDRKKTAPTHLTKVFTENERMVLTELILAKNEKRYKDSKPSLSEVTEIAITYAEVSNEDPTVIQAAVVDILCGDEAQRVFSLLECEGLEQIITGNRASEYLSSIKEALNEQEVMLRDYAQELLK